MQNWTDNEEIVYEKTLYNHHGIGNAGCQCQCPKPFGGEYRGADGRRDGTGGQPHGRHLHDRPAV